MVIGLWVIATAFYSHSLSFVGAEGWTMLDLLLPPLCAFTLATLVVRGRLSGAFSGLSPFPLFMFIIVISHIVTDPRADEILAALASTKIPTGGFRMYYSVAISMLLYYMVPLVVRDSERMRKLLKIYLGVVLFQILFTFFRIPIPPLHRLPWDSYNSQIMQYDIRGYWGGGIRPIVLGDMALHLFVFSLVLLKPGRWRSAFVLLSLVAVYISKGRAPMFSIVLATMLYMMFERRKVFLPLGASAAVLCALLFFGQNPHLLQGMPAGPKRILSVLSSDNPEYQTETFSRMEMWTLQAGIIARNPLWGSTVDFPREVDPDAKNAIQRGDTHGVYLGMAAVYGLPMLIFWLIFVGGRMRRLHFMWSRTEKDERTHQLALWLGLLICAYVFKYFTSGNAGGGYNDAYVLLALVDVVYRLSAQPAPVCRKAVARTLVERHAAG